MSEARDREAEELFLRVVDAEPEARKALLDELAPDPQLRGRVERFLDWDARAPGAFLAGEEEARPVQPGARIGPYQVIERLGEGGMGTVFAVRQSFPRRDVALKVMRSGRITDDALRRFRYEIDTLGRLQHVGIARIYDAGLIEVDDQHGLRREVPYFTMELVRGVPLNTYAAERQLDLPARLELLARVADGVQYAHQHGIIHRDLKSENVLVTTEESSTSESSGALVGVGQPKILDFGIARAVKAEDSDRETLEGTLLGSLSSMSPEQVAGTNALVGVRSDVYALGVMLYELLAQRPPLELSGLSMPQAVRRIQEEDPRPLGDVVPHLRGDLTVVTGRALEKDPERRYPSAADLAADLRHVLRGEPIEARADSRLYLLHRSLRRHRFGIGAALIIALLTVALAVSSSLQARRSAALAESEASARKRSEEDFARALEAVDLLTSVAMEDLVDVPRAAEATRRILRASLDFHQDLIRTHGDSEELRARSARARARVGRILDDLGRQSEAREALTEAVSELQDLRTPEHPSPRQLASGLAQLANTLAEDGDLAAAEAHARRAIDLLLPEASTDPEAESERVRMLSYAARNLSTILARDGLPIEALEAIQLALEPLEQATRDSGTAADRAELVRLLDRLTRAQLDAERDTDVAARYEQALLLGESLLQDVPESATYLSDVMTLLTNYGLYLGERGQPQAMQEHLERAVDLGEQLASDHPGLVDWLETFAMACNNLASCRSDAGRYPEAADLIERGKAVLQDILERAPSAQRVGELGFVENNLGAIWVFLKRYEEARDVLLDGCEHLESALVDFPNRRDFIAARDAAQVHLAQAQLGLGHHLQAVETLDGLGSMGAWMRASQALRAYQDAARQADADDTLADPQGTARAYLERAVEFLEASKAGGLEPPASFLDQPEFSRLAEHAVFVGAASPAKQ